MAFFPFIGHLTLSTKGAFEAAPFLLFFRQSIVTYCFSNKRKGGAEKPVPSMIFLVSSRPLASSSKGQGDVENILVPSH